MVYDMNVINGKAFKNVTAQSKLELGVYEVNYVKDKDQPGEYKLVPYDKLVNGRFSTPPVIYGDIMTFLKIVWNTFAISEKSEGSLFFGNSGSGKTDASNIIANICLNNNLPVVIIQSLSADMELVKFIDNLGDCCIIFEEFGKVFPYYIQQKMLSLFSATGVKRLYIVNDNDKNGISPFILNRPGRISLKKEFSKLELPVFEKYISDHGVQPNTTFFDDMMKMYKTTTILSMDHVKYIIKMHTTYPEFDLKYILSILNVDVLSKPVLYKIMEIKKVSDGSLYKVTRSPEIEKSQFDGGRDYYLALEKIVDEVPITTQAEQPNPNMQQGMMGGRGYDPTMRLQSFKLTNTRLIDSNKVFVKFEVNHNDEKFHVTLVIDAE